MAKKSQKNIPRSCRRFQRKVNQHKARKYKRKQRTESFRLYIYRVLKRIYADAQISRRAMSIVNSFVGDMFERLATEAGRLLSYSKKRTLTAREIQSAVRLVCPGDLATFGVMYGQKALNAIFPVAKRTCMLVPEALNQAASETDEEGRTELHRAAADGDVVRVKELLTRGFDTRAQDEYGDTPLNLALLLRKEAVAELLVDADSTSNLQDVNGWVPLHHAAINGYVGIARKLIAAGVDMRLQNCWGWTPLHGALHWDMRDVAKLLVDADCGINSQDGEGCTPLHLAADKGYTYIVWKMLLCGVWPHKKNYRGQYPLNNALKNGHEDVVEMILATYVWRGITIDWLEMKLPEQQTRRCMELLSECGSEIQRMKDTMIGESTVSYHTIAVEHVTKLVPYLANDDIRKVLFSDRVMWDFPYYCDLIALKVKKAEDRRVLVNRFLHCFSLMAQGSFLPSTSTNVILCYLSNQDLRNFNSAFHFEC